VLTRRAENHYHKHTGLQRDQKHMIPVAK